MHSRGDDRRRRAAPRWALSAALFHLGCFVDRDPSASETSSSSGDTTAGDTSTTSDATSTTSSSTSTTDDPGVCGDAEFDLGEECDLGDENGKGGVCKADCTLNVCGDGYLGPGEDCDDGDVSDFNACTTACTIAACGDGFLQLGEGCDDGNDVGGDGCTGCVPDTCGDGTLDPTEACDDGNDITDDDCTNACTTPACGDGIVQIGEECDAGVANAVAGLCSLTCVAAQCGDGVLQAGEECDDGNAEPNDGCSQSCLRDARFAFVTESLHTGALGGLAGADAICQAEAEAAGLTGQYLAWLADDLASPSSRFTASNLPYLRTDGQVLAVTYDVLRTQGALVPLDRDASGAQVGTPSDKCSSTNTVWTNTNLAGIAYSADSHCEHWSVAKDGTALLGRLDQTGSAWTNAQCVGICSDGRRVYCLEQ